MPLSLVPQVFYDLIARVIPGFVLIMMWYLTILGPNKAIDTIITISSEPGQSVFSFWSFAMLVILSYVLGFVLDELRSLTFGRIRRQSLKRKRRKYVESCIAHDSKIRKCFGGPALELENQDLPPLHTIHDHLRLHSQSEAYRLLKLRAEARLSEVIFTGFSPLPLINILFWYKDSKLLMLDRMVLELVLIIAMIAFWRASNRFQKFYITGVYTSWLFYSFPIGPLKRTETHRRQAGDTADE